MAGSFWTLFMFDQDRAEENREKTAGASFACRMMNVSAGSADDEDHDELYEAGIDPEELEFMGLTERREILTQAGLDPDDYDF